VEVHICIVHHVRLTHIIKDCLPPTCVHFWLCNDAMLGQKGRKSHRTRSSRKVLRVTVVLAVQRRWRSMTKDDVESDWKDRMRTGRGRRPLSHCVTEIEADHRPLLLVHIAGRDCMPAHSVAGGWFGVVVTALVSGHVNKVSCVEPG